MIPNLTRNQIRAYDFDIHCSNRIIVYFDLISHPKGTEWQYTADLPFYPIMGDILNNECDIWKRIGDRAILVE